MAIVVVASVGGGGVSADRAGLGPPTVHPTLIMNAASRKKHFFIICSLLHLRNLKEVQQEPLNNSPCYFVGFEDRLERLQSTSGVKDTRCYLW
jgi:hypothetical protein